MVHQQDVFVLSKQLKIEQRTKIILIILSIILAIIAFVLIICCIVVKSKYFSSTELCETDYCIRAAASLRLAMNTSVDPCDDFYKFSCDRWTKEHPEHGWVSPISAFTMVAETVSFAILKFFQTSTTKKEPLSVRQLRDLFASCVDQDTKDKLGYTPIYKYLSLVGLPNIPTFMNLTEKKYTEDQKFDWVKTDALGRRLLGSQMFIGLFVNRNSSNSSIHFLQMGVPSMLQYSMPSLSKPPREHNYRNLLKTKDDTEEEEKEEETADADKRLYSFYFSSVVKTKYAENDKLPEDFDHLVNETVDAFLDIQTAIREIMALASNSSNNNTNENITIATVQKLQDITNEYLESINLTKIEIWKPYLEQIFSDFNADIDYEKDVIILLNSDILYLNKIVEYLINLPDELIELWMWGSVVVKLIIHTTLEVHRVFEDIFSGILPEEPLPITCITTVSTYMGMAMSYAIADVVILNDTREKVDIMLKDIQIAFKERVHTLEWMDSETKERTLEKCNEMLTFTGYPDWIMKDGALDIFYSNLTIHNDTYLDNVLNIIQRNAKKEFENLHSRHIREWPEDTYPITANAFYIPYDNAIVIPMAFLFFPLYNLGLEVLNYAATGCTLGHELIHGFDDTGRQFDKFGNTIQWWNEDAIDKFEDLAKCFVDQYNNFYVPEVGRYVDGEGSLGENIADNDGLRLAYIAYQYYKRRNKDNNKKLPGLEQYTDDQLFFIAYASTWCDEMQSDNEAYTVLDPHCPKMFRLIGSLQNSEEFSKAFNCPKGSKMNPLAKKCSIW